MKLKNFLVSILMLTLINGCHEHKEEMRTELKAFIDLVEKSKENISGDWKTVAEKSFKFSIPMSLIEQNVRGIDSKVGEYKNDALVISYDYGPYSGSESTNALISGKEVHVKIDEISSHHDKEKECLWSVSFPSIDNIDGQENNLNITARSKNFAQQELAAKIFGSIEIFE